MTATLRLMAIVLVFLLAASAGETADWSRFRGSNGSGVSPSTGLPVEFGPTKNLAWSAAVPFARSSPVFTDELIFLTAIDGDRFSLIALARESGEILWRDEIERLRTDEFHQATDSATPSPVTDGASVYAFFQETGLVSYTAAGERRWQLPLGPFRNFYGIASSPILAGKALILVCDQAAGSYILAVDKDSGQELWKQPRPGRLEAYSTPVLYPEPTRPRQLLVFGSKWLDAYDPTSGKPLWSFNQVAPGPVASPVLAGDVLFLGAPDQASEPPPSFPELAAEHDADGDGRIVRSEVEGSWLAEHYGYLDANGDGWVSASDWEVLVGEMTSDHWGMSAIRIPEGTSDPQLLWRYTQNIPYIPSPLVYEGVLYMVKDGIVSSLDPQTGELLKRDRLTKGSPKMYASPVAADGKIYFATLDGQVAVVEASPDWQVLALNELGEEIHSSPAIVDGHLYVRTRENLYAFATSRQASTSP